VAIGKTWFNILFTAFQRAGGKGARKQVRKMLKKMESGRKYKKILRKGIRKLASKKYAQRDIYIDR
jgi:hypothetical protein